MPMRRFLLPFARPLRRPPAPRAVLCSIVLLAACAATGDADGAPSGRAPTSAAADTRARPPLPVDSFVPLDEALRRFRAPLGAAPTRLAGGEPGREQLARAFVRAVATRDTAALNRLLLSRAEFAWLYYPSSPLRAAPYELDPQMAWYQLRTQSEKGIARVLDRMAGDDLVYRGLDCPSAPRREGENRVWDGCVLRYAFDRQTQRRRLFGGIVARAGAYKFVGYANDF